MNRLFVLVVALTPAVALAGKSYNEGSGDTYDCKADPTVSININNGTFTFTGACQTISVNGNNNTITIESVKTLSVNGNGSTISVAAVTTISTNGNQNKVTYKKGLKPHVSNPGTGNAVAAGDLAAAKADDKAAAKSDDDAGGAGVVDCAKHPTYNVGDKGKLSLKFVGACETITVGTGENQIQIDKVKKLVLDGGKNNVDIGEADAIVTNGAQNQVTYHKGKPKISGAGAKNTVVGVP